MSRGWWKLTYEWWDEKNESENLLINDIDREHIAAQIQEGMIEGELNRDNEDDEIKVIKDFDDSLPEDFEQQAMDDAVKDILDNLDDEENIHG